jgi:hypothetical protein
MVERQVRLGDMHGLRQLRRIGILELETESPATVEHQQVELRAGVRRPEVGVAIAHDPQHLLERKPLPRRAELRVPLERRIRVNPEQSVEQPAVAELDFWRFDLTLANVLVPGRELSHDECARQNVEMALDRRMSFAEDRPISDAFQTWP